MLDRNSPPAHHPVTGFELIAPRHLTLANGLNVFVFNAGEQEVVRMEWIFEHVFPQTESTLINSCACEMLLEGTSAYSSSQIAEKIDFHGAFLIPQVDRDRATLSLFSLYKHLDHLLPLVKNLLTDAIFPEKELATYIRNNKQKLEVSLQKNSIVARRLFHSAVFGQNRYGISPNMADFDGITREDLLTLFRKQYAPSNCTLIISGKISDAVIETVTRLFGETWTPHPSHLDNNELPIILQQDNVIVEDRPDALQSALRLGYMSIQRSHPDFPGLQVVNTLLGGYFGSRLMANIREDKGYTYSVGSGLISLKHSAFLTIASEVGAAFTAATLKEIEKEIERLKTESVGDDELSKVKNYVMGSMLGSLENVFSHADKFKNVYFSGLELDYYAYYTEVVRHINADDVLRLANTYLDYEKMVKVIVGKPPLLQ